jgi:hypothetical protein
LLPKGNNDRSFSKKTPPLIMINKKRNPPEKAPPNAWMAAISLSVPGGIGIIFVKARQNFNSSTIISAAANSVHKKRNVSSEADCIFLNFIYKNMQSNTKVIIEA